MKNKVIMNKIKKVYHWFLIIIGSILSMYIIYVRIIQIKLPKEMVTHLYEAGCYFQLSIYFVLIIGFLIQLAVNLSKKHKK